MTITLNGTNGITTPEVVLDNTAADGGQVVLKSSGYNNWNWDNFSGRLRAYYGSTEYFTVTSSGNVGIGTSSPNKQLAIGSSGTSTLGFTWTGDNLAKAGIEANHQTGEVRYAAFTNYYPTFYSNNTERMRIDSSGNLLVNRTTQFSAGQYSANFGGITQRGATYNNTDGNGGANFVSFGNAGTVIGTIQQNGTSNVTYATSSDYRLKENIQPMQNALAVVQQLNPVTYTWKADGSDGQGFIAHELQAVVPDCVTGEKDATRIENVEVSPAVPATFDEEGNELIPAVEAVYEEREVPVYQGIDTSFLVATLTKAIQELKAQLDESNLILTDVRTELDATKAEVAALKGAK